MAVYFGYISVCSISIQVRILTNSRYVSTVVEEYISEGVQEISTQLKISQSLSGVTFLAFAGGAGE